LRLSSRGEAIPSRFSKLGISRSGLRGRPSLDQRSIFEILLWDGWIRGPLEYTKKIEKPDDWDRFEEGLNSA